MKFSIIIPTLKNFRYLKLAIDSIKKNSSFENELIVHLNGDDLETENFLNSQGIKYTKSSINIGLCSGVNLASKKSTTEYIVYAHDDMYFLPKWDFYLAEEINNLNSNFFYFSSTQISHISDKKVKEIPNHIHFNAGENIDTFDEKKLLENFEKLDFYDLQGSHWAPHVIHKDIWNKIGGFSEEFNPGDGSDPDFCMKLWFNNVRVFKGISKFKVYHFNSLTTRNDKVKLNNGTKIFLLKYGFNPKFFRKYYLKGNNSIIPYRGILDEPKNNFFMFIELIVNKLKYLFYKFKF